MFRALHTSAFDDMRRRMRVARLDQNPQQLANARGDSDHPLLALAAQHLEMATQAVMGGRFNTFRELSDPSRMLVVYRRHYGAGVVSDEYYVAQPTYFRDASGQYLRPGETIVFDFEGEPAVAVVEALLFRRLLEEDPEAQALVSRYLANHG
jgi:hypothetical protein